MTISTTAKTGLLAFVACALVAAGYISSVPQANAVTPIGTLAPGSLFRGQSLPAVYYLSVDGTRYVFPNQNTYDTWYNGDFSTVQWVTDIDLTKVQIGGNVTYKPGTRMIKINSDPRTYMPTENGTLRHVTTEAVATAYYGSAWNTYIDDLADGFFTNYTIGAAISDATQFNRTTAQSAATSIDVDKGLVAPEIISIGDSGYSPIDVTISAGEGVKFVNNGSVSHTATADDLTWGTGTLAPGAYFIRRFNEPGVYTFFDSYDGSNTGAIYVN